MPKPSFIATLVSTACACAVLAQAPFEHTQDADASYTWRFAVHLEDKPIGEHTFTLQRDADGLRMETRADFAVKFLFFTAYTYQHEATEFWDQRGLARITAFTDANGDISEVEGQRSPEGFQLIRPESSAPLPAGALSFAYWNPAILEAQRLLNSQTGEYQAVSITAAGDASVRFNDTDIPALRYDIALEKGSISLWYAKSDKRWLKLESVTETGRLLRYLPTSLPIAAPVLPR